MPTSSSYQYPKHWIPIFPNSQQSLKDLEHVGKRMSERNLSIEDLAPFKVWRDGPGRVPPNSRWHVNINGGAVGRYGGKIVTLHESYMVPKNSLHIPIVQANGKLSNKTAYNETIHSLEELRPELLHIAQEVYDRWDPEEDGMCHEIAASWSHELKFKHHIESKLRSNGLHTWVIIPCQEGNVKIDIPFEKYEEFTLFPENKNVANPKATDGWFDKREGVVFSPDDLIIKQASRKNTPLSTRPEFEPMSNGWALDPDNRQDEDEILPLEEMNPALFKEGSSPDRFSPDDPTTREERHNWFVRTVQENVKKREEELRPQREAEIQAITELGDQATPASVAARVMELLGVEYPSLVNSYESLEDSISEEWKELWNSSKTSAKKDGVGVGASESYSLYFSAGGGQYGTLLTTGINGTIAQILDWMNNFGKDPTVPTVEWYNLAEMFRSSTPIILPVEGGRVYELRKRNQSNKWEISGAYWDIVNKDITVSQGIKLEVMNNAVKKPVKLNKLNLFYKDASAGEEETASEEERYTLYYSNALGHRNAQLMATEQTGTLSEVTDWAYDNALKGYGREFILAAFPTEGGKILQWNDSDHGFLDTSHVISTAEGIRLELNNKKDHPDDRLFIPYSEKAKKKASEDSWKAQSSGVVPICSETKRICLAWRSEKVEEGNCWGTLGGAVKKDMSPEESAKTELQEETGYSGPIDIHAAFVFKKDDFTYSNFIGVVDEEFTFQPTFGHEWENDSIEWFTLEEIEQDIKDNLKDYHPGIVTLFEESKDLIHGLVEGKAKQASDEEEKYSLLFMELLGVTDGIATGFSGSLEAIKKWLDDFDEVTFNKYLNEEKLAPEQEELCNYYTELNPAIVPTEGGRIYTGTFSGDRNPMTRRQGQYGGWTLEPSSLEVSVSEGIKIDALNSLAVGRTLKCPKIKTTKTASKESESYSLYFRYYGGGLGNLVSSGVNGTLGQIKEWLENFEMTTNAEFLRWEDDEEGHPDTEDYPRNFTEDQRNLIEYYREYGVIVIPGYGGQVFKGTFLGGLGWDADTQQIVENSSIDWKLNPIDEYVSASDGIKLEAMNIFVGKKTKMPTFKGKTAGDDPREGVKNCQECGEHLNGDDVLEVNKKVVCPDCANKFHTLQEKAEDKPVKGQEDFRGIPVYVEFYKGERRHNRILQADYGFIPDTTGRGDGEAVDVYVGENEHAPYAYIVEQLKEDGKTLDEVKLMYGFDSLAEAEKVYLAQFDKGWRETRVRNIYEVPVEELLEACVQHRSVD